MESSLEPEPVEPPHAACEVCEHRPGTAVQDAMTRALLIDRPAPGDLVQAHGWTMRVGAGVDVTTLRCPEHAR